jgi:hypothetical protein
MNTIQNITFDDEATRAMGVAFDLACSSHRQLARAEKVRELIVKRIIEAAINKWRARSGPPSRASNNGF